MSVVWHYDSPVCTGLGDRLGMVLTLSALAILHNSSCVVHMEWCTEPQRAVLSNPQFMKWIPGWTGYDFPLLKLQTVLALPKNILLYPSGQDPKSFDNVVREGGELPGWGAVALTSTMYCRAMSVIPDPSRKQEMWTARECEAAYRKAGSQLLPARQTEQGLPYILIHFRSGDSNTEARDERPFCTRAVLQALHAEKVYMKVISNNHSFSMQWMRGMPSVHLVHSSSAFQDVLLALSAVAIVQHASTGWSSYTSVPAMARGVPLINTFTGSNHRFDLFKRQGEVPREFYMCRETTAFVQDAVSAWKRAQVPV